MQGAAVLGFLAFVNTVAFAAFWWDKRQSCRSGRRTPEKHLLTLAIVGGWPAAKLAQRALRHKTRKQPFAWHLNLIGVAWAWALAVFTVAPLV